MSYRVFMQESFNGHEAGRLVAGLDYSEAHLIQNQRKGVVVDAPDEYERQITQKVEKYREEYNKITQSDDPVYKVEGAIDYYVKQMQEKLDKEVAELTQQWRDVYKAMQEEAAKDAARFRRYITETEKESARQHATKAANALKYAGDSSVLEELVRLAPQMPNGQKLALMDELERIEGAANGKHGATIRRLYSELSSVTNTDLMHIKVVELLGDVGVDRAYRNLKMIHRTYKHLPINMNNSHRVTSAVRTGVR
ncbi:hypothetical protein SAMN05661091_5379 [Paenibacillus uliginis N3/975]|uniref:Uncharacterized protein n=1 Tax=Paenibacillus uliginis N3/975 TaxID=1313296 RepID=A0A1X7HQN5_9BACL|nr:hypothetical protein [Paenibacillus uliginis]SMF91216.1 hypothetical protein SAMN05661091_5379 [Paenibacillus uliginis N3/975]